MYVDTEDATPYLGNQMVISSWVFGGTLELSFGDGWQKELQDPKLGALFNTAPEKLTKQCEAKGKGKGSEKGKGKSRVRS